MQFHELHINGIQCVRKYRFEVAHREFVENYNNKTNFRIYGNSCFIHGHNYELYVLLQGQEDKHTGMVIELSSIDRIVNKEIVDKFDHQLIDLGISATHESFALVCSTNLSKKLQNYYGLIMSENIDRSYTKVIQEELPMVYRTHIIGFTSTHQLFNNIFNRRRNNSVYGKCQRLHGHNYKLSVTVSGTPNYQTGLIINSNEFDSIINLACVKYDHQQLHKMSEFNSLPATTENFIKILWYEIDTRLVEVMELLKNDFLENYAQDLKLDTIVLQETDRNIFVYKGE